MKKKTTIQKKKGSPQEKSPNEPPAFSDKDYLKLPDADDSPEEKSPAVTTSDADISPEEEKLLEEGDRPRTPDERQWEASGLDDTDAEGAPLNEKGFPRNKDSRRP